jgi:hypothetical protein
MDQSTGKKLSIVLWIIAFIITTFTAYYQRVTGPTYPISGSVSFTGKDIFYKFNRSSSSNENSIIKLQVTDDKLQGVLLWKRFNTNDELTRVEMKNESGVLTGELPKQPPAGKLQYFIRVIGPNTEVNVPKEPVLMRFKGDIPFIILVLHVLMMFAAMLFSTRTGLEIFRKEPNYKKFAFGTLGLLTLGGLILGSMVQKYAFGEYWTGIPFGFDLTDNKTLIAWLSWIVTIIMIYRSGKAKYWVLGAAIITIVIFLIPHSLLGT